jgi:hypothetical protein
MILSNLGYEARQDTHLIGRPAIRSEALSAIAIVAAFVLPLIVVGMTDASTTRNPSTPCTFNRESTTFPMLQVLVG